jgi:flagellar assembly protein FliH
MESKFKPFQFKEDPHAPTILKVDDANGYSVSSYQATKLNQGVSGYRENKAKYGPMAATDQDRNPRDKKDERFRINPASRNLLDIEQEEQRAIDERVRSKIDELKIEALASAQTQGYSEGLEKARLEVIETFRAENQERSEQFAKCIDHFENFKSEIFRANERYLVELICRISRLVILKELSSDQEYLQRLSQHLIERVGIKENIRIRLHPDDFETAGRLREGLEGKLGELKNLKIDSSTQVDRGGCQLETDWNLIDAGLDSQLKAMHDALVGGDR